MSQALQPSACPVCLAPDLKPAPPLNGYPLAGCRRCEFVFATERSFPSDIYDRVYAEDPTYGYMKEAAIQAAGEAHPSPRQLWWSKRFALRYLERHAKGRLLLDVGCGPGQFLLVARDRGWNVQGLEPTPEPAEQARSYGLSIYEGTLEEYVAAADARFDAVTSFEVLEHVPEPVSLLRAAAAVLRPGGLLVLSVPNLDDPYILRLRNASSLPPIHVNFFNRRSMTQALVRAGLRPVTFRTIPVPTASLRMLYGKAGLVMRLPWVALLALMGKADGTTLVAVARHPG